MIRILTDSASDLTATDSARPGVYTVPLSVTFEIAAFRCQLYKIFCTDRGWQRKAAILRMSFLWIPARHPKARAS